MYLDARLLLIGFVLFNSFRVCAHDVVWPGNPSGFTPTVPLRVEVGTNGLIQVQPVTGESCIVEVNLDVTTSTLVKAEIITENPARQVDIRITPLRGPAQLLELVMISGEWHATGDPDPEECTALLPNRFSVTIHGVGPPAPTVTSITSRAGFSGEEITIRGTGFTGASQVRFADVSAVFTVVDDSTVRVTIPADAPVGKIRITTPGGIAESVSTFVTMPMLTLTANPNGPDLQIQWNDRNYPFTLQRSSSLDEPEWQDLIRTVENSVSIRSEDRAQFYRLLWMEIPLDLTDYNRDRPAVAAFYHRDPVAYWATFGIPALARLSIMRQNLGLDPWISFEGFLQAFDTNKFLTSLKKDEIPPPLRTLVTNELAQGASLTNAFLKSLVALVSSGDSTNCLEAFRTNCLMTNSYVPVFTKVMTNAMSTNKWGGWAPLTNKTLFHQDQLTNYAPNWIDQHGSDSYARNTRPVASTNDDSNTTFHINWDAITTSSTWNTTYDAACAAVAVGASLAKLGAISTNTTCQFWNDLSRLLGATPGTLGAFASDISDFYGTLGYGCNQAYDGPFESAAAEAKKALERGCDVQIYYYSLDGSRGHTEIVTGITIDPNNSSNATISTLSWGSSATVTYTGSVTGGEFSGKSDGQAYRKPGETDSYLEQTGISVIRYYCKQ